MKGGSSIELGGTSTKMGRWLPPLSLIVDQIWRCRSLAHLEHELVDFVIRVRVESEWDGGLGWYVRLQLTERSNFSTSENVVNCALKIAL